MTLEVNARESWVFLQIGKAAVDFTSGVPDDTGACLFWKHCIRHWLVREGRNLKTMPVSAAHSQQCGPAEMAGRAWGVGGAATSVPCSVVLKVPQGGSCLSGMPDRNSSPSPWLLESEKKWEGEKRQHNEQVLHLLNISSHELQDRPEYMHKFSRNGSGVGSLDDGRLANSHLWDPAHNDSEGTWNSLKASSFITRLK